MLGLAPFGVQPWWVWGFPRLGFLPLPLGLEGSKAAVARSSRACSLLGTTELWASREISCPFRMCPSPLGGVGGGTFKATALEQAPCQVSAAGCADSWRARAVCWGRGRCSAEGLHAGIAPSQRHPLVAEAVGMGWGR